MIARQSANNRGPRPDRADAHERLPNFIGLPGAGRREPLADCRATPRACWCSTPARSAWCCAPCCLCEAVVAVAAMFGAATPAGLADPAVAADRRRLAGHAGLADRGLRLQEACWRACAARRSRRPASRWARWRACTAAACWPGRACWRPAPWVASAFAGALLSAVLVAALVLRAKGRTPAATTARLAELQSRIRPHFLFNTLNSAIALVRAEPAKAESLLEDLSDLFRHALVEPGRVGHAGARRLRWRSATWTSSRCVLASACRWNGRWTRRPTRPACRRCCCSRWWRTPCKHGVEPSADGRAVRISTQRRGAQRGDQGDQHRAGRQRRARPRAGAGQCARAPAPAARRAGPVPDVR